MIYYLSSCWQWNQIPWQQHERRELSQNEVGNPLFGVPIILRFVTLSVPVARNALESSPPLPYATIFTCSWPVPLKIFSTIPLNSVACSCTDHICHHFETLLDKYSKSYHGLTSLSCYSKRFGLEHSHVLIIWEGDYYRMVVPLLLKQMSSWSTERKLTLESLPMIDLFA